MTFDRLDDRLDDRLEWPLRPWRRGGPWRLGHGLTVVGPGWWPLVRHAFAAVAAAPGGDVLTVRQKAAVLEVRAAHPDAGTRARLRVLAVGLAEASRVRCEGCGQAVPRRAPGRGAWRNHCAARAAALAAFGGESAERRLWEWRAGRSWPASSGW